MKRLDGLLSLIAVVGCSATALGAPVCVSALQDWDMIEPGIELEFPADHGAHPEYRTEWWYLTGQARDSAGRPFGYQFTIFRSGLGDRPLESDAGHGSRVREVFAAHLAISDVARGEQFFAERLRRAGTPLAQASVTDLDLVVEDWAIQRTEGDVLRVKADDPATGIGLELELRPTKPLVFHGEGGYSAKGGAVGNASAYVSWTRLATRGRLTLASEPYRVEGESWFDHEFGSSVLGEGIRGWDWFGLMLDDGRELMLFRLRDGSGAGGPASAGTLVDAAGKARALLREDFILTPTAHWTSPRTGAVYPAAWTLAVPQEGIELQVLPLMSDAGARHARVDRRRLLGGPRRGLRECDRTRLRGVDRLRGDDGRTLLGR